jgi:SOS-response transcriptional repressor LexA
MNWRQHAADLEKGLVIQFRPKGNSMTGKIESGQLCTISPFVEEPQKGDIVLCKVKGRFCLHIIKAAKGNSYLIGNNRGHLNGWTSRTSIFGKCTEVSD